MGSNVGALRSFTVGSVLIALALALFLLSRRASGDISSALPLLWLIPTAAVLVAWAWLVRLIRPTADFFAWPRWHVSDSWLSMWSPFLIVVCFAVGLSYPGTRLADWIVWFIVLAAVLTGPQRLGRSIGTAPARARKQPHRQLLQDIKRFRGAAGRDAIQGTLTAEFSPGQRTAMVCAAFCPPFDFLPQVTARAIDSKSASVKVAQLLHNGVQLEVRLPRAASSRQVVAVELQAVEPQP